MRYVVLHHTGFGEPHFDLMFETALGSPLATWRANEWPLGRAAHLTLLGDHRGDYLDYEGPVSGNRGVVRRVQSGTHVILEDGPRRLVVELEGGEQVILPRG